MNKYETLNCCNNAPCEILHTIALEEAALSHILNAEGEKIQKAVAAEGISIEDLLSVNNSVAKTIREVTSLEIILLSKLEAACSCNCRPIPPPVDNDGCICINIFNCRTREPLQGAKITICKGDEFIADGYSDHCGQYVSKALPFGTYTVKSEYKDQDSKLCEVNVNQHCCNDIQICFEIEKPCFPIIKTKIIRIKGYVKDQCGRPLANACVRARGVNLLEVYADHYGFYEICQLIVIDHFSVTPKCSCCTGLSRQFNNITKNCYIVNLIAVC